MVVATDQTANEDKTSEKTDNRRRSLLKTLSWRVLATATTVIIAWAVTGDAGAGATIGGIEATAKMALYYGHERAWARI